MPSSFVARHQSESVRICSLDEYDVFECVHSSKSSSIVYRSDAELSLMSIPTDSFFNRQQFTCNNFTTSFHVASTLEVRQCVALPPFCFLFHIFFNTNPQLYTPYQVRRLFSSWSAIFFWITPSTYENRVKDLPGWSIEYKLSSNLQKAGTLYLLSQKT